MKVTQSKAAGNKAGGVSKTPKQPGHGCGSVKNMDQKKVVASRIHAKCK